MASDKIIERNRRNGAKSKGPKTAEGKARSRLNAVKYGLTAQTLLLPGEDAEHRRLLEEALRADLEPVGAVGEVVFAEVFRDAVRLSRIEAAEASLLLTEMTERSVQRVYWKRNRLEDDLHALEEAGKAQESPKPGTVVMGQRKVSALEKALTEHRDLQEVRDGPESDLSVAYANGAESLRLNDRYRTTAMKRFLRGVAELLAMKAERETAEASQEDPFLGNLRLLKEGA